MLILGRTSVNPTHLRRLISGLESRTVVTAFVCHGVLERVHSDNGEHRLIVTVFSLGW
jgi:hypothetical protein